MSIIRFKRRTLCFIAHNKEHLQDTLWSFKYQVRQRVFPGHWYWLTGGVFHFNRECAETFGKPHRLHPDKSFRYRLCEKCSKRLHRENIVRADEINEKMPGWILEVENNIQKAPFDTDEDREYARGVAIVYMRMMQAWANLLSVDYTELENEEEEKG